MIDSFNRWFLAGKPPVALVKAAPAPNGMRLGGFATADFNAEDVYLSVPLPLIMDVDSAYRSPLAPLLEALKAKFKNADPFHELLLHLLYEKFQRPLVGEDSFWRPYLDTLPTPVDIDFPLFWSDEELQELQASQAKADILDYRSTVRSKFGSVAGVLQQFAHPFDASVLTFENYRWAHAILDSRAIWWGGGRHLVPMLDLLNCVEGPDPARIHSTKLDAQGSNAVTLAPWSLKAGDQVYENYGQPNHIYFTYHGFVLDSNTHDCVQIALGVNPNDTPDVQAAVADRLKKARFRPNFSACVAPASIPANALGYIEKAHGVSAGGSRSKLNQLAQAQLRAYSTSAEQDEQLLQQSAGKSWRYVSALKLRLSEKRLLAGVIAATASADSARHDL